MSNIRLAVVQNWTVGDVSRNITISVDELLGTKDQIEATLQSILDTLNRFELEAKHVSTDIVSK